MKKSLIISAKFDTAELDRSITQMQQKLKDIYAPADAIRAQSYGQTTNRLNAIGMGVGGPATAAQEQVALRYRRELMNSMREEVKKQEELGRKILEQENGLKKLVELEKSLSNEFYKQLEVRQKINAEQDSLKNKTEEFYKRDQELNRAAEIEEKFRAKEQMERKAKSARISTALGIASAVLEFGAEAYEQLGRSGFRTKINTGAAIQGTIGRTIEDLKTPYGQAWMTERIRAVSDANKMDVVTRRTDLLRMAAGATAGAASIPMLMSGAATLPGIATAGAGLFGMLGNERMRALSASNMFGAAGTALQHTRFSPVGNYLTGVADQQMKEYNSILAREFAQNFQKALTAEQQNNPLKDLAAKQYDENFMQYLQVQRALGLNFGGFHGAGGFRQRMIDQGFTEQMGMDMAGQILGSGGSTRMGRNAGVALRVQRGADLTNAGQVLGLLSRGLGDERSSEEALIRILAKGTELGLDRSEFAEENRKFSQAAAEIIGRQGAISPEDAARLSNQFGGFVADRTGVGIQAAQSAYERYQQISSSTTGPRGVMAASAMMSDEKLKMLPVLERQALADMREEDINEGNPAALSIANKLGISVAELAQRKKGVTQFSISRFKAHDEARERLRKFGLTSLPTTAKDLQALPRDIQRDIETMSTMERIENPGISGPDLRSLMQGQLTREPTEFEQSERERLSKRRLDLMPGREEDKTVQNIAESGRLALESFQNFHKEMSPTVETIKNFNTAVGKAVEAMKKMAPEDQGNFNQFLKNLLGGGQPQNQPQSGSQSK